MIRCRKNRHESGVVMKKIFCFVLALTLAFCLSVFSFASTITVNDYKISFDLPDEWYVVTKDSTEDEEVFEYYLYYEPTIKYLEESGISVFAVTDENLTEFDASFDYIDGYLSLRDYSPSELDEMCNDIKESWENDGYENCFVEIYEGASEPFIKLSYDLLIDGTAVYAVKYLGYVDNLSCAFSFYSYNNTISVAETEIMNSIIDSIESSNAVSGSTSSPSSARFLIRNFKGIVTAIIAAFAGAFAWIKSKFRKKNKGEEASARSDEQFSESPENTPDSPIDCFNVQCPSCGAMLSEDAKVCPLCGQKITK